MKRHPPKLQNLPKVRFILEIFWHKKWLILYILLFPLLILFYATTGLDGLGLLLVNVFRSYSIDTPHTVGRPSTSDRQVAETST